MGVWSALVGSALHSGGVGLAKKCDLFHYSTGLEPVGSVHFRAPALALAGRRDERGAARAANAKTLDLKKIEKFAKNIG